MSTSAWKRRGVRRVWVALAILGAFAAASCGKKEPEPNPALNYEKPPEFDRELNQTEIDSMRAMKVTHRVTRDQYWDGRGGVIANDRIEVWYSNRKIFVIQAMAVLKQMDQVAVHIQKWFGRLPEGRVVVVTAPELESFRKATGLDWWHYASIKADTISMQTPMTLFMRGLLQVAARKEYSRWALEHFTNGKAPHWVVQGMAGRLGGERDVYRGQRKEYGTKPIRMDIKDIEKNLAEQKDRLETRRAMYNAFLMVDQLVQTHGMPQVAAFILALGEEASPDAAAQRAFSKSYDEVLAEAQAWTEPVEAPADSAAPAPAGHDHPGEK
ncbi:MAG TPA: hypothetical protein VF247_09650 [Candidatus Krumholzibacteria bacterium]